MHQHERALLAQFDWLARGRSNIVSLVALRAIMGLERSAFDVVLASLRRAGVLSLSAAEGRHGLTDADRAAAIREGDTLLLFVSRRPS